MNTNRVLNWIIAVSIAILVITYLGLGKIQETSSIDKYTSEHDYKMSLESNRKANGDWSREGN